MPTNATANIPPICLSAEPGGLHQMVERVAIRFPGRVAIKARDRTLSYGELDAVSTRWAAPLASAGVGPSTCAPILMPRSVDLVLSLLAVLKTGASFALLDRQWPRAQLESVLSELGSPLVIAPHDATPVNGAQIWSPPGDAGGTRGFHRPPVGPGAACCVFFTSGTSGWPKGVIVPHRAISRLFVANTFASFDEHTIIPLSAATPWDAFALELWGGLLHGGTAVVVAEPFLTPEILRRVIREDGVNTVWLTTSLFNMIVDEDRAAFDGLGQVLVGGERLSTDHVRRFMDQHPRVALTNGYGPVESTIFASAHRVVPMDHLRPGGIPLGVCVPGTQVYILDADRECGRDQEGEICIAGDGLAIEYLGDPDLTATKFTTVTLDGRPTRVYRTGDLGVWRSPDGLLEFHGRADRQVKVRGHRVEPAEIENAIVRLSPAVRACRVVPRRNPRDQSYELVAFCIPRVKGDQLSGLSEAIAMQLPAYQRQAQLVVVGEFPLNDRGKISDTRLLEQATRARDHQTGQGGSGQETAGSVQDLVSTTFAAVLGFSPVPRNTSFFALGGSSLDAGRVCARLGHQTGLALPVSQFYRHQTVAELASWLEQLAGGSKPPMTREPDAGIPLTALQTAFLLRDIVEPDGRTNHCLVAWRIDGQVNMAALDRAILGVHQRQEALRAAYTLEPRPHASLADGPAPILRVLRPAESFGSAIASLTAELAQPFYPSSGLVWRTALVPISSGQSSIFGCSVHHVAFDGWSEAVLAYDLSTGYNGGPAEALPPSLEKLAFHRRIRLQQADTAAQVSALSAILAGVPEMAWPARGVPGAQGPVGCVRGALSSSACDRIARLGRLRGTTRFPVLLTAWSWALRDVTSASDIAVGVPVSDRAFAGQGRTIGCHLVTVPVRLRDAPARTQPGDQFAVGVDQTAQQVDLAMACQDAPLDEITRRLRLNTSGRWPLYQTIFALQDNRFPVLEFQGVGTTLLRLPYLEIPTELHCELWPQPIGGMAVEITFQPRRVAPQIAQELLDALTSLLEQPELGPAL